MYFYLSRLTSDELTDLINTLIKELQKREWGGKVPVIDGEINYITITTNEKREMVIQAKRVVGKYAVYDIAEFVADDYSISLLAWGRPYISLDTQLHEYLACRFGKNYIDDYYEYEQERIVKENIRLTLLASNTRK